MGLSSFHHLLEKRKCAQCEQSLEDILINPNCDHVVCGPCLRLIPQRCPACKGELIAKELAPDRAFKALWRHHLNMVNLPSKASSTGVRQSVGCHQSLNANDNTKLLKAHHKRNAKGETVLHQYCSMGFTKKKAFDLQKLKSMIDDGANPNTHDAGGVTPMHEAILYDELDILKVLLDGGGRVNCYRVPPYTLLHLAVVRYEPEEITEDSTPHKILRTLLDYGADKNAKDCYHRRPIDLAKKNKSIIELLTSYKPVPVIRNELLAPEMPIAVLSCLDDKSSSEVMKNFVNRFKIKLVPPKGGLKQEVTHVVVAQNPCEPTFIVRQAILSGCFIVTFSWIEESLKHNCILPADDFEISEPLLSNSTEGFVSRRARISLKQLMPKLFAGGQFHILSNNVVQHISHKEKDQIVKLIETGGGTILSREPRNADTGEGEPMLFHAKEGSMFEKCSILILFKTNHL
uniref:BRCA1-associated RING domain protein 1 n=1 Tax=Lygus hesperus TaxID=30085 RepID=A0A0A9WII0_LYGHE